MIAVKKDEIERIERMIQSLRNSDIAINSLLTALENISNLVIIGGALRSALQENYKLRDVDLILDPLKEYDIDKILLKLNNTRYKKNRFGGYKVIFNTTTFDIWTIHDHWGFKEKFYKENIENIEKTTLLNYDSLVYDYSNKILYSNNYENCIRRKIIDMIGKEEYIKNNPSPYINIMRMLKIKMETGYELSNRSYEYIKHYYNVCGSNITDILINEYKNHYKYLNRDFVNYVIDYFKY
ncbi:MAG: hypothetical protein E6845_01295 [Clostridium sp.]|uniref:hypothetical protein n=1 Tax=Clostridium sp. TaxID=1506 RepID=UPI002904AAE8|nr:hypothetical protein [Clostridium sp.]MDU1601569.1 hypothetical protein [Clostridium sp.]